MTDLKSTEFPITTAYELGTVPRNLLIDHEEASVVYFESRTKSQTQKSYSGKDELILRRFNLRGELQARGTTAIPIQCSHDLLRKPAYASDMVGCYTVLFYLADENDLVTHCYSGHSKGATVQFDTKHNKFVDPHKNPNKTWEYSRSSYLGSTLVSGVHLWKNVTYLQAANRRQSSYSLKVRIDDLHGIRDEEAEMHSTFGFPGGYHNPCISDESIRAGNDGEENEYNSADSSKYWLFGDGIFLVQAGVKHFKVFCFDQNITM